MAAILVGMMANHASAESLSDAIRAAYDQHPQLLAARSDAKASDAALSQAKAAYGPSVNVTVAETYTDSRVQLAPDFTVRQNGFAPSYELVASQPLFSSGRLSAGVSAARAGVALAQEQVRQTEQNVLSAVINAYVSVRRDQQLVLIARENVDLLGKQRGDTDARTKAREATATDLQQTDNRLSLAQGQLLEAVGQLHASEGAYAALIGHPPASLDPEPPLPGIPSSLDEAYMSADANNPTLLAGRYRELQSRASLAAAKSSQGPNVSLEGSITRNSTSPYNNQLRTDQVLGRVVVTMPIFTAGRVSGQIREATAANDRDWYLIDQARRDARQSVAQSWVQLKASAASLPSYQQAVTSAEEAFAGAREQERLGARASIEVLDQARDLLQSRTTLIQARANAYLYQVSLLVAMGRLQAPLLVPSIPAYSPTRHRHLAGIPGVSPALQAIDRLASEDLERQRPSRDAAVSLPER